MPVKPIPDAYTSLAPYLFVDGAREAIEFYKRAFGATDHGMIALPDGKVAHAEVKIGDTVLRLCDNLPMFDQGRAPTDLGGTTVQIFSSSRTSTPRCARRRRRARPSRPRRRTSTGATGPAC